MHPSYISVILFYNLWQLMVYVVCIAFIKVTLMRKTYILRKITEEIN